jgi:hypothetical protein
MREEVRQLHDLGPLPSERGTSPELVSEYEQLLRAIKKPLTNDEARALVKLFGSDGCFGLASTLLHLIESAPGWPLKECLVDSTNEWIVELRERAERGGML